MNINFFNYKISSTLPDVDLKSKIVINTLNAHSFIIAEKDNLFKKSLENSDILVPDGSGIQLATKFLKGIDLDKVAGLDIHNFYLKNAEKKSLKIFYLGSTEETLDKIKVKINTKYPNIVVKTYSPPFKDKLSFEDNKLIINEINNFNPNILFVGMTAPKQEKWVFNNLNHISANVICSIGAVFDFFSGNVKRANQFFIDYKIEWVYRLMKDFRKIAPRLPSIPKFIFYVIKNRKNFK